VSDEDRIRDLIVGQLSWNGTASELTDDYPLIENHVIDSLGMIDLIGHLESEFGISVGDEDLVPDNFATVSALAAFVESKR
jgi:acyl carrier protein